MHAHQSLKIILNEISAKIKFLRPNDHSATIQRKNTQNINKTKKLQDLFKRHTETLLFPKKKKNKKIKSKAEETRKKNLNNSNKPVSDFFFILYFLFRFIFCKFQSIRINIPDNLISILRKKMWRLLLAHVLFSWY